MSTPNFSYENRCVLVTSDDIECGNIPEMEAIYSPAVDNHYGSRSYPSREIKSPLEIVKIVITNGYYQDACIDYIVPDNAKDQYVERNLYTYTGRERPIDVLDRMYDRAVAIEIRKANKIIDQIKENYGYQELSCKAIFSNGEAVYERV